MSYKELAIQFLTLATTNQVDAAFELVSKETFLHHNPWFSPDCDSLMGGMKQAASMHPQKEFTIQRVIEEGDLVAVHSRIHLNPQMPVMAVVHIFRFEAGKNEDAKIVEMWDIGQAMPESAVNDLF